MGDDITPKPCNVYFTHMKSILLVIFSSFKCAAALSPDPYIHLTVVSSSTFIRLANFIRIIMSLFVCEENKFASESFEYMGSLICVIATFFPAPYSAEKRPNSAPLHSNTVSVLCLSPCSMYYGHVLLCTDRYVFFVCFCLFFCHDIDMYIIFFFTSVCLLCRCGCVCLRT